MKKVIVSGAAGRLGGSILRRCLSEADQTVVGALVRPGSKVEALPVEGASDELVYSSDFEALVNQFGADQVVLIEASLVPAALKHLEIAAKLGVPVCLATTGFSVAQQEELKVYSQSIALLWAPNLSLGVNVMHALVAQAAKALPNYHVELVEIHHAQKRDAPSGTAWALAKTATEAKGRDIDRDAILARAGDIGPRGQNEVGIQTLRGGHVFGEHTVYFVGETERIEIVHRAASRDAFAWGAVRTVEFLSSDRPAGWYSMSDVLSLS